MRIQTILNLLLIAGRALASTNQSQNLIDDITIYPNTKTEAIDGINAEQNFCIQFTAKLAGRNNNINMLLHLGEQTTIRVGVKKNRRNEHRLDSDIDMDRKLGRRVPKYLSFSRQTNFEVKVTKRACAKSITVNVGGENSVEYTELLKAKTNEMPADILLDSENGGIEYSKIKLC